MSRLQRASYITFLALMASQSYIKTDGWRYVVIGMALFAIAGIFVARHKDCV